MGNKRVIGLDASPTHVGLALFEGLEFKEGKYFSVKNMKERFKLVLKVVDYIKGLEKIDIIVIENYKYNLRRAQNVYQIGEFIGLLKYKILADLGISILMVFPSRLNKIVGYNKRNKKIRIQYVEEHILKEKIEKKIGKIKGGYEKVYGDIADAILLAWIMVMYYNGKIRRDLRGWYKDLISNILIGIDLID